MSSTCHHLQLRLDSKMKTEIRETAGRLKISESDVVRGALYFGLPVFATMNDIQESLIRRFIAVLKKNSRSKSKIK